MEEIQVLWLIYDQHHFLMLWHASIREESMNVEDLHQEDPRENVACSPSSLVSFWGPIKSPVTEYSLGRCVALYEPTVTRQHATFHHHHLLIILQTSARLIVPVSVTSLQCDSRWAGEGQWFIVQFDFLHFNEEDVSSHLGFSFFTSVLWALMSSQKLSWCFKFSRLAHFIVNGERQKSLPYLYDIYLKPSWTHVILADTPAQRLNNDLWPLVVFAKQIQHKR